MVSSGCTSTGRRRTALLASLALLAAGAAGCGSSAAAPPPPGTLAANWEFTGTSAADGQFLPNGTRVPIGMYLTQTDGKVSGNAWVQLAFPQVCQGSCCGGPFAQFNPSLTGTIDSKGNLKVTSAVANGGPVFTMTGQVSGNAFSNGKFTLTGSCPDKGTIAGTALAPLNGTYAGTMTSKNTGNTYTLTATLQQSSTPNSRGFFNVNGTAKLSGYACISSATAATPLDQSSGMLGNRFSVSMNTPTSGVTYYIAGTLAPDGKTISATYVASGGACNNDFGTGTLTLK